MKPAGGQTAFSGEEESAIVATCLVTSAWGFPLTPLDIRHVAQRYLNDLGRVEKKFTDNFPGRDWVRGFLERHKAELSARPCNNLNPQRAKLSIAEVEEFVDNFGTTCDGVPPENIFNYDETGMTDSPGVKTCIFKRGTKYADRVVKESKASVSVMFCGSASGVILPPYVCYKCEGGCNPQWTRGATIGYPLCNGQCCSRGVGFGATKSGWFDTAAFGQWFEHCFLPHAKALPGKKVLLGDNLISHFNDDVISMCNNNNIAFTCLPANATHLLQPLDVAFFHPLKAKWRDLVFEFRNQHNNAAIPKSLFPAELKKLLVKLDTDKTDVTGKLGRNLLSGFVGAGLCPLSKEKATSKLPKDTPNESEMVESVLVAYLRELRTPKPTRAPRKSKRAKAPPGTSIMAAEETDESETEAGPSNSGTTQAEAEGEAEEEPMEEEDDEEPMDLNVISRVRDPDDLKYGDGSGDFAAVVYQPGKSLSSRKWYIGRPLKFEKDGKVKVKFLEQTVDFPKTFKWPKRPDVFSIPFQQVLANVTSGIFLSKQKNVEFEISDEVLDEIEKCFLTYIKPQ